MRDGGRLVSGRVGMAGWATGRAVCTRLTRERIRFAALLGRGDWALCRAFYFFGIIGIFGIRPYIPELSKINSGFRNSFPKKRSGLSSSGNSGSESGNSGFGFRDREICPPGVASIGCSSTELEFSCLAGHV